MDKIFALFRVDIILIFLNLITGIVVARNLGPEAMGLWTILLLIPGYAEVFGRLKFDIAAVYFLGKNQTTLGEMTFHLHLISIVMTVIMVGVFIYNFEWFYSLLYKHSGIDMRDLCYLILIIIPFRLIFLNYTYLHIANEGVHVYNMMLIAQALVTACSVMIMLYLLHLGILGVVLGNIFGVAVPTIYAGSKLEKIEKIKINFNIALIATMAKQSIYHYLNSIAVYFQSNLMNLIMPVYLGPVSIGFFSLGKSIAETSTRIIPNAVSVILLAKVAKQNDQGALSADLTAQTFRASLVMLIFISACAIILIKPVVLFLYGAEYSPIAYIFWGIIPGVALSQSSSIFCSYFTGIGRADLLTKILILPLLIQAGLSYWLIAAYGVNGAIYSLLISASILFITTTLVFISISCVPLASLWPKYNDVMHICGFIKQKFFLCKYDV